MRQNESLKPLDLINYQSPEEAQFGTTLTQHVRQQALGAQITLATITPFSWEKVCSFGMGVPAEVINDRLGFKWLDTSGVVGEDRELLVFTIDQTVVQHVLFYPYLIPGQSGRCWSATEAIFTVDGYDLPNGESSRVLQPNK